jgi:hypothetical protein
MTITLTLLPAEITVLNRPVNGQGGFQTLFRTLQARVQANGTIDLTDAQVGRIVRHISYRPGGFEDRLDAVFGRSIRLLLA